MRKLQVEVYSVDEREPYNCEHVLVFMPHFACAVDSYYADGVFWVDDMQDANFKKSKVLGWMEYPAKLPVDATEFKKSAE